MRIGLALVTMVLATGVSVGGATAQPASTAAVRSCSSDPAAYKVPGSDTCLRIGGYLATEATMQMQVPRGFAEPAFSGRRSPPSSLSGSRIDAAVHVDARTQTELGPVRVFVSVRRPRNQLP